MSRAADHPVVFPRRTLLAALATGSVTFATGCTSLASDESSDVRGYGTGGYGDGEFGGVERS